MNLRLPFFVSLGLALTTACGSFEGTVDGTATDGGGTVADATAGDSGGAQDGAAPTDGGTPAKDGGGAVTDSGVVVVDAGNPNASLCDGLTALGNGDFNSKIESGTGAFTSRGNGYTATLEQDGGQAFLPTKMLSRSKLCLSVDATLSANADNLSANYQLVGGQIGHPDVAQFGAIVNNGNVAIGYRNGAGATVNVGSHRNFRLELLVDNTLADSKLRYRVRTGGGQVLGEGEIAGGGGTGTVLQVGLGCANASGNSCKQLSVDGVNFSISGN